MRGALLSACGRGPVSKAGGSGGYPELRKETAPTSKRICGLRTDPACRRQSAVVTTSASLAFAVTMAHPRR